MKKLLAMLALCLCLASSALADELTGAVLLTIQSDLTSSAGFGGQREKIDRLISRQWSSGVGTYSIDQVLTAAGDIAGGASVTLDLIGGDAPLGGVASFGHLKALAVENAGSTTLTIGSGTAPILILTHATDTAPIQASGVLLLVAPGAGYAVSSGTADSIHIEAAAGGTGSYRLWAVGVSQ